MLAKLFALLMFVAGSLFWRWAHTAEDVVVAWGRICVGATLICMGLTASVVIYLH